MFVSGDNGDRVEILQLALSQITVSNQLGAIDNLHTFGNSIVTYHWNRRVPR